MDVNHTVPERCPALLFSKAPIAPERTACVVIPVKNEAARISQTLAAFAGQVDVQGRPLDPATFEILLLANNCTDSSVEQIQAFSNQHPALHLFWEDITLPPRYANIGYVRRLLMDTACRRLSGTGLILTTDGDTRVAPDWIAQTQWEIANGADAVGGRILLDPAEIDSLDAPTYIYHQYDDQYRLLSAELEALVLETAHNPSPTHHQHFNGSFAVTAATYIKAGGIPPVTHLEDCAFFERLQHIDAKVRHSTDVWVYTSARYAGRADIGLSDQLKQWQRLAIQGTELQVESGWSILQRLTVRKALMDLWRHRKQPLTDPVAALRKVDPHLQISAAEKEGFRNSVFFGSWYAQVIQPQAFKHRFRFPDVPIKEAILQLRTALATYSDPALSHTSIR
ncbi:MAG: glycosyltransferase [Sphingobacteriales bacterium]|nr:MAG: glycosyltransferase [Sphingobacteriales bacterium]